MMDGFTLSSGHGSATGGSPRGRATSLSCTQKYEVTGRLWRTLNQLGLLIDVGEVLNEQEFDAFTEDVMRIRYSVGVDPCLKDLVDMCLTVLSQLENEVCPRASLASMRIMLNRVYFILVVHPISHELISLMRSARRGWAFLATVPLVHVVLNETTRGDVCREFLILMENRCSSPEPESWFAHTYELMLRGLEFIQFMNTCPVVGPTLQSIQAEVNKEFSIGLRKFAALHPDVVNRRPVHVFMRILRSYQIRNPAVSLSRQGSGSSSSSSSSSNSTVPPIIEEEEEERS
mgnify:CR=1 FL=1